MLGSAFEPFIAVFVLDHSSHILIFFFQRLYIHVVRTRIAILRRNAEKENVSAKEHISVTEETAEVITSIFVLLLH